MEKIFVVGDLNRASIGNSQTWHPNQTTFINFSCAVHRIPLSDTLAGVLDTGVAPPPSSPPLASSLPRPAAAAARPAASPRRRGARPAGSPRQRGSSTRRR